MGDELAKAANHEAALRERVSSQKRDLQAKENALGLREASTAQLEKDLASRELAIVTRERGSPSARWPSRAARSDLENRPPPCRLGANARRAWSGRRPLVGKSIRGSCAPSWRVATPSLWSLGVRFPR